MPEQDKEEDRRAYTRYAMRAVEAGADPRPNAKLKLAPSRHGDAVQDSAEMSNFDGVQVAEGRRLGGPKRQFLRGHPAPLRHLQPSPFALSADPRAFSRSGHAFRYVTPLATCTRARLIGAHRLARSAAAGAGASCMASRTRLTRCRPSSRRRSSKTLDIGRARGGARRCLRTLGAQATTWKELLTKG